MTRACSVKKVFLRIHKIQEKNTCAGAPFQQ